MTTRVMQPLLFGLLLATFSFGATSSTGDMPATLRVKATAYCQAGTTSSGTRARAGIVAADPEVLPVGSQDKDDTGRVDG